MTVTDLFNESWYLRSYPDVAAAAHAGRIDARLHFELYGSLEGRSPGPLFNAAFYLSQNPDVASAVGQGLTTAYEHFIQFGMAEGRNPVAYFDEAFYLAQNPDVAAVVEQAGVSAIGHFLQYGLAEGRSPVPWFDPVAYLSANGDVAEGWATPAFEHLLLHGAFEDRPLGNGLHMRFYQNDPVFNHSVGDLAFHEAIARIGAVAPFFREFQGPPGWRPAADTPIPVDFIPPAGMKLVLPPSVLIPDGMVLPDTFEPVTPPGPGPGPAPKPAPWLDCDDEGVVCLEDGDAHTAGDDDEFYVLRGVDARHGTVIKVDGYEEYVHMIDLSRVKNLVVYGGPDDAQRLQLRYGKYDEIDGKWLWDDDAGGDSLALSFREGQGNLELTGAADNAVFMHVGAKAHSFGFEFVQADIRSSALSLRDGTGDDDPEAFPLVVTAPGFLAMGGDGGQIFALSDDSMALGGNGADWFMVGDDCGCDDAAFSAGHGPAIIGDYQSAGLDGDVIFINTLDLGGLFEDAFRASAYSLDAARGLVRNGSSQDVELVVGGATIAHIASLEEAAGAAGQAIVFSVLGGMAAGVASIEDGAKVESLYADGSDSECGCPPLIEILLGGQGAQTIEAGHTLISLLGAGSGDDVLTGREGANYYLGGRGNDNITLKGRPGDDEVLPLPDTVVFGKDAEHNGLDTIEAFSAGCFGDVLDFTAFLSGEEFSFPFFRVDDDDMVFGFDAGDIEDDDPLACAGTGSEQILIVESTVVPEGFQAYIENLYSRPGERYVVLRKTESDTDYEIYFVEMSAAQANTQMVATLGLAGGEALTAWNFTPWLAEYVA